VSGNNYLFSLMLRLEAARVPISEPDGPNDDTASIFKLEILITIGV